MRLQRYSNGERISVTSSDLAGTGGEARVYAVPSDERLAAKIYHRPSQAQEQKLRAMLHNPPDNPTGEQAHISIAWPIDLLSMAYGDREFAGYLMPRACRMHPLFKVYNPSVRRQESPLFSYLYLHRAGRNLSSAVAALHNRGYVIGDVNESNILVSDRALITLVDTDSFQVTEPGGKTVYRCQVGKAEYTPPELQGKRFSHIDRTPEHDRFGLAALIFQLLMEGTHPFAGIYSGSGDPPPYEARIASGHFPYGECRRPFRPMPAAPSLEIVHPRLRQLFLLCFEEGHRRPELRPDAQTWHDALREAEKALVTCKANPRHLYGSHLASCPWCARTALLGGRDPFPAGPSAPRRMRRTVRTLLPKPPAPPAAPSLAPALPSQRTLAPSAHQAAATSSWQWSAPVTASASSGLSGVAPSPTLFTFKLRGNGWAWGSLCWAISAVAAIPLGLPGLNLIAALLAVGFGAVGWHSERKPAGPSRWMSAAAVLCAIGSLAARPLASASQTGAEAFSTGDGAVRSLSFSPDGLKLAVGTSRVEDASLRDGEVELWDVASRQLTLTPEHVNGDVVSVAFSPNGRSVAAATDSPFGSGELTVVDVSANGAYRSIFKERRHMRQVAYSPDGRRIASAGAEPLVRIWNAKSLEIESTLELPSEASAVAFSPDGALLAVGCRSSQGSVTPGYVTVWEAATGHLLWSHSAHGNGVLAVQFAPNRHILASGGNDGAVCLWDARGGRLMRRQTAHTYGIAALAFAPDGSILASAETQQTEQGAVNEIVLRNPATGAPIRSIHSSGDSIQALTFSPKGSLLASGSRDGTVRLWHVRQL